MNQTESIKELAIALNKAQTEMKAALKDSSNPFFKSRYADFASVWETCRAPLTKHGLSVSQLPIGRDGLFGVRTILMHVSGEWISEELLLPVTKQDPQAAGSAITYARRYSLSGIVCLATEDDDDGNKGSETAGVITEKQAKTISDSIDEKGADRDKFCEFFKISSISEMPANKYDEAVKLLKAKKKVEKVDPVGKAEDDLKTIIANKNKELGVDREPGSEG